MHSLRIPGAAALAAGILTALLAGGAASGAFAAAPPQQADPTASPSVPTPDPSAEPSPDPSEDPSTDPSPEPSTSPTTSPSTSPSAPPRYDMSITGSRAEGQLGDVVRATVTIDTAGADRYELYVPTLRGGADYAGPCEDAGIPRYCRLTFDAEGAVDTRTLEFKIVLAGTTPVEVSVHPLGGSDPDESNNRTHVTVTTNTPGRPHDMTATAHNVSGKVGDIVTVTLDVEMSNVPDYFLHVPITSNTAEYVGRCDSRVTDQNYCAIYEEDVAGPRHKVALKFKITKVGKSTIRAYVYPTYLIDPDHTNNYPTFTVEGLPADGAGGGGGDGDLPLTGSPTTTVAAVGAGILGAGVILYLAARRRRTSAALADAQD